MIPDFLRVRYATVRAIFHERWPEREAPPLPEDDPNAAVMAIDQMLAPLQGREPTTITRGEPVIFHDRTPELPAHPVERNRGTR